jgi:hypothetical protein
MNAVPDCYGTPVVPPGPDPGGGYGRDRACAWSGVCPPGTGAAFRLSGYRNCPPGTIHLADDLPGYCGPVPPGAGPAPSSSNCFNNYTAEACTAAGYGPPPPAPWQPPPNLNPGFPPDPSLVAGCNAAGIVVNPALIPGCP